MARLLELIKAVASATGQREQGVTQLARHLREAGLIRQGGRGRAGAIMGPTDAANLLLGVMVSDMWQDAPERVRLAREATFNGCEVNLDGMVDDTPPELPFLLNAEGKVTTLGEALDALLAEMSVGDVLRSNGLPVENLDFRITRPGLDSCFEARGADILFVHFHRNDPRFDGVPQDRWQAKARELFPLKPGMTITASVGMMALDGITECIA